MWHSVNMNKYILISIFCIQGIYAQEIVTDRPDQTESSSTIPNQSLQIECGIQYTTNSTGNRIEKQLLLPTTLFRIGVIQKIEFRILSQLEFYQERQDSSSHIGLSDIEIGTKIQLFQRPNSWIEVAFLSHLVLPIGSFGLSNEQLGSINKVCISHPIGKEINLGYNIGYNYFGDKNGDLTYSLALGFEISEKASIYIEPFGTINNFIQNETFVDFGFCYLIHENLQIDFSLGTGVTKRMNYLSSGFSWLIQ